MIQPVDITAVVGLVIGIAALAVAMASWRDGRALRQEFNSPAGTPAAEVQWAAPSPDGKLACSVRPLFGRVTNVTVALASETKDVPQLEVDQVQNFSFESVPEGARFKLSFTDPIERRKHRGQGIVRYAMRDILG